MPKRIPRNPAEDEYLMFEPEGDHDVEDLLDEHKEEGMTQVEKVLTQLRSKGHKVSRLVMDGNGGMKTEAHSRTFEKLARRAKGRRRKKSSGKPLPTALDLQQTIQAKLDEEANVKKHTDTSPDHDTKDAD